MKHFFILRVALLTLIAARLAAQPYGIDSRSYNNSLVINSLPPATPGSMSLTHVYTNLTFILPTFMTEIPDGSGRFAVLEKSGVIKFFPKAGNPTMANVSIALNINSKTATSSEQGLLGLAFDPDYRNNGILYIYYSWNGTSPGTSRVSRFINRNPSGNVIDPSSEEILWSLPQPYTNHNGGMIAFGPDGMLYIAVGDGGSGGDPGNRAQDTTNWFGSILRIDVRGTPDPGLAYRIPTDNPFYSSGPGGAATKKEIWAYGLRNPWRFSFDRQTDRLFLADVGQSSREEVNIIEKGGNYGWRIMEGTLCFNPSSGCNQTGLTLPIAEYNRSLGQSITGGYVYYGTKLPSLYGKYVYADYGSGRVWALGYNGSTVDGPHNLVGSNSRSISTFAQDAEGEIYLLDIEVGRIYALTATTTGGTSDFPLRLSSIPALLAAGKGENQTNKGIIPYEPSSKLWSDGTLKTRFIAVPELLPVSWRSTGAWIFPERTVLIKNFLLPTDERNPATARRIETRLLYLRNGEWNGFSYEWNDEQTDAELLQDGKFKNYTITDAAGQTVNINYRFPSRSECNSCHTAAAGGVLGINTPQMNFNFKYPGSGVTDNQLRTLEHIGLIGTLPQPPAQLPAMPDYERMDAALNSRARAYLASNCSQCHRPGGGTPTSLDFRWETPNSGMNAIGVPPSNGNLGLSNPHIIKPYTPAGSVLMTRIATRGASQMPPLATSRVDAIGTSIIRQWIGSLGAQNGAVDAHHFK